jgi:DNA polymerase-3 subunit gamma/tau
MTFEDVVGQQHITRTLRNSLKTGRIRHAYLFSGPRGTGKTTTARLLAKAVNCRSADYDIRPCNQCDACLAVNEGRYLDLIEIDAATHTGVDDVRDLRDKIAFTPGEGRYKVYIIDEVHRFSGSAFDALLKTLEEPPDHAIFVLATTEIDRVPQTIKSRCLQFEFRRVSLLQVADRLELIARTEGLNIDREALELIARQGTGSVRDSISLLDQIFSDPAEHITLEEAQRILGTANIRAVRELATALVQQDAARGLYLINTAIDAGSDPRQFGQQIVEHLRAVMLAQTAGAELIEASDEERALYQSQADQIDRRSLLRAVRLFNDAVNEYRGGWQPQLALELALVEATRPDESYAAPVMMMQQAAPVSAGTAAASAPAPVDDLPPAEPGAPPVMSLQDFNARWRQFIAALTAMQAPVVEQFRALKIEGNVVYLATDNPIYYQRLYGQTEKLTAIERKLRAVYDIALRVQVVLVDDFDARVGGNTPSPGDVPDRPIFNKAREVGGKIKRVDKE